MSIYTCNECEITIAKRGNHNESKRHLNKIIKIKAEIKNIIIGEIKEIHIANMIMDDLLQIENYSSMYEKISEIMKKRKNQDSALIECINIFAEHPKFFKIEKKIFNFFSKRFRELESSDFFRIHYDKIEKYNKCLDIIYPDVPKVSYNYQFFYPNDEFTFH